MSFNILDCFDDNINNLDITKNYIYVLLLEDERYYVGRTTNILNRIEHHFTGYGALYTAKYKPLKVIEVVEELTREDERNKTLEIMNKYGWKKVRGSQWCSLEITEPNKNKKYKKINSNINSDGELVSLDVDVEIYNLYCNDNKNIIEIGNIIKKTPGWIAHRLTKLKIIDRIQLARGFFEYYQSDIYKKHLIDIIKNREQNKINEKARLKINENARDIKKRIREKILNVNSLECI